MTESPFAAKNQARRDGRATTTRTAYREARALRRAVNGTYGQLPRSFWAAASVGTRGESIDGGSK